MGLAGAKSQRADPVSSLWPRIILSNSRQLAKALEFRIYHPSEAIKDQDVMMDTSIPRNFSQSHPILQLRFVDQYTEASHLGKHGAVTAATPSAVCSFTKPTATEPSCVSCCKLWSSLQPSQLPLCPGHLPAHPTHPAWDKGSIALHLSTQLKRTRSHFLDNCYYFIHLVTNFHCVCQVSEAS